MASRRQLAANRANAELSTGPRTPQGKARSSLNALTHGLTAQTVILEDEDPEEFERFRKEVFEYFRPHPLPERELVERIAVIMWRMRRIPKFEAALIKSRRESVREEFSNPISLLFEKRSQDLDVITGWALIQDSGHENALGKLSRHEAALMNQLKQTLQLLQMMQSQQMVGEERLVEAPHASDSKNAA